MAILAGIWLFGELLKWGCLEGPSFPPPCIRSSLTKKRIKPKKGFLNSVWFRSSAAYFLCDLCHFTRIKSSIQFCPCHLIDLSEIA